MHHILLDGRQISFVLRTNSAHRPPILTGFQPVQISDAMASRPCVALQETTARIRLHSEDIAEVLRQKRCKRKRRDRLFIAVFLIKWGCGTIRDGTGECNNSRRLRRFHLLVRFADTASMWLYLCISGISLLQQWVVTSAKANKSSRNIFHATNSSVVLSPHHKTPIMSPVHSKWMQVREEQLKKIPEYHQLARLVRLHINPAYRSQWLLNATIRRVFQPYTKQ